MEAGAHSIWVSEQIQRLGHEVIVANVRELRTISHSDRKSDKVDAEKIARYARLDPDIPVRGVGPWPVVVETPAKLFGRKIEDVEAMNKETLENIE
jgi:hypothetical protein